MYVEWDKRELIFLVKKSILKRYSVIFDFFLGIVKMIVKGYNRNIKI